MGAGRGWALTILEPQIAYACIFDFLAREEAVRWSSVQRRLPASTGEFDIPETLLKDVRKVYLPDGCVSNDSPIVHADVDDWLSHFDGPAHDAAAVVPMIVSFNMY